MMTRDSALNGNRYSWHCLL